MRNFVTSLAGLAQMEKNPISVLVDDKADSEYGRSDYEPRIGEPGEIVAGPSAVRKRQLR